MERANLMANTGGTSTAGVAYYNGCRLRSLVLNNLNQLTQYLLLYNQNTTPISGQTPVMSFTMQQAQLGVPFVLALGSDIFGTRGVKGFDKGLAWAISGTVNNYDGTSIAADHAITLVMAEIQDNN